MPGAAGAMSSGSRPVIKQALEKARGKDTAKKKAKSDTPPIAEKKQVSGSTKEEKHGSDKTGSDMTVNESIALYAESESVSNRVPFEDTPDESEEECPSCGVLLLIDWIGKLIQSLPEPIY